MILYSASLSVLLNLPRLDNFLSHDPQYRILLHSHIFLVQAYANSAIAICLFELNMNFTNFYLKDMPSKT